MRNGFILAVVALVVISVPLVVHGIDTARSWMRATAGAPFVREWIGDRDLAVTAWSIEGNTVTLLLAGPDAPGDAAVLAAELAKAYGAPVALDVQYVQIAQQAVGDPDTTRSARRNAAGSTGARSRVAAILPR